MSIFINKLCRKYEMTTLYFTLKKKKKNRIYQCFWCLVPKVKFIYLQRQNYSPKIKGSVANSRLTNQTQVLYLCFANIYSHKSPLLQMLEKCIQFQSYKFSIKLSLIFFILHFFSFSFSFYG